MDYTTNEVSPLFQFDPDPNMNPFLVRIIDAKFSPDGEYLQFSVGGFRENPNTQASVSTYHLGSDTLEDNKGAEIPVAPEWSILGFLYIHQQPKSINNEQK